ncbi:hypothetical protein HPP92_025285 [Vanilla planifolia]|uniref:Beta-amylase n=1 Tax=Vanilla planifolia TaxID=51239 RepID=A0A835PHL2_VANPL|nr:hypothetical protein HPP92_025285 [Vanilla planifolia]
MKNSEHPTDAMCRPEELVTQVATSARAAGVMLAGENALPRYDEGAFEKIVGMATAAGGEQERMHSFTYLRMGPDMFQEEKWRRFVAFVGRMREEGWSREEVEMETEGIVQITSPLIQEAALAL